MDLFEDISDFYDLELRWAHASSRLGSMLMEQPASTQHLQHTLDEYYEKMLYSSATSSIDPNLFTEITELFFGNQESNNNQKESSKTGTEQPEEKMQQLLQKLLGEQTTNELLDAMAQNWQQLDRVETYLYNAARVYQKALTRHPNAGSPDRIEMARSWAAALQNLGTVRLYKESPESIQRAADTYLQAIHVYENEIFSVLSDDDKDASQRHESFLSNEQFDARMGMAESMFSLSTAYLELGKYSDAKHWYQKCSK
jgi:TolA-binding protein